MGTPVAADRIARSGCAALFSSAAFVPLAWLATGYGIYLARETGWHGLRQLGESSDTPGVNLIWFVLVAALPFWLVAAFLSVCYALAVYSQKHPPSPRPVGTVEQ